MMGEVRADQENIARASGSVDKPSTLFSAVKRKPFPADCKELRDSQIFCDAVIFSSDGVSYRVHKVILSAISTYFKKLFTSEISTSKCYVHVQWPASIVREVIDFIYTGKCDIQQSNVAHLLPAADYLAVVPLVDACCTFLARNTTYYNCWGVHRFAVTFSCTKLADFTWKYLIYNFVVFYSDSPEFFELPIDPLVSLLKDDLLNVRGEQIIHNAIEKWISFKKEERLHHLGRLIKCIRFPMLSIAYYQRCFLRSQLIREKVPLDQLSQLRQLVGLGCNLENRIVPTEDDDDWSHDIITRPRVPYHVLFAIGGWSSGSPTNSMETYDIRADEWVLCSTNDMYSKSYHGTACADNLIYVVGGFDGAVYYNTVRCYDPVVKVWSEKACMYQARCYVAVVYLEGYIYAIGGFNGRFRMETAERYSVRLNQWQMIAPMNTPRSDAGATCYNRMIFVAGGFDGEDVLQSVEVYSLETGTWTLIQSMFEARSGVSLVTYYGEIYALGGFNGQDRLSSIERFDPERAIFGWSGSIPDMFTSRSNFACIVLEDKIFAIGGHNGISTCSFVECYSRSSGEWHAVSNLRHNRSALSSAVCSGLPNAIDYTHNAPHLAQGSDGGDQPQ